MVRSIAQFVGDGELVAVLRVEARAEDVCDLLMGDAVVRVEVVTVEVVRVEVVWARDRTVWLRRTRAGLEVSPVEGAAEPEG